MNRKSFLFAAVLEDEKTCRLILEIILGREMPHAGCIYYQASRKGIRVKKMA